MSMRPADRLIAVPRGTRVEAVTHGISAGAARVDDLRAYAAEVFRLAPLLGLDPSVAIAQSAHETGYWSSAWWVDRLNPAGIGITGDPVENAQSPMFDTGTEAAAAQLSHLLVYALGPTDAGSVWYRTTGTSIMAVDSRYDDYVAAYGNVAKAETINALSGTWAVDRLYAEGVVARGNAIYPDLPDQTGGPPVAAYTTSVPGLPGGPLTTDYPIKLLIVPPSQTNNRPGITAHTPRRSVQHGNGNPNSNAASEARYLFNGAEGRQASYHATGDDLEVWVMIPLDEVTWQAADGGGPGNMNGYSCEMIEDATLWSNQSRIDRCIHNCADFMGRVAARFGGVFTPERHWDFNWAECCDSPCDVQCGNRHHCPDKLMSRGLWDGAYTRAWQAARVDELRQMGGGTRTTTTTAAPVVFPQHRIPAPDVIEAQGFALTANAPARFRCLQGTRFRTYPDRDAPAATATGAKAGKVYTFAYRTETPIDGEVWLVSAAGSWVMTKNFEVVR